MLTVEDEDDLIEDITEGVEIALYEGEFDFEDYYIDDIKLNKLVWWIDQELDEVELTYGWFKYGPAPVVASHSDNGASNIGIEPKSPNQIDASDESRVPTPGDQYPTPREYAWVFLRELREEFEKILQMNTKEYLVEFYEDNAPEPYHDLYCESAHLQIKLDAMKEGKGWHENAEDYYHETKNRSNRIYGEQLQIPSLKKTVHPFQRYTSILSELIAAMADKESISDAQQRFLRSRAIDYFYGGAWKYITLYISEDTAKGPNVNRLLDSIDGDKRTLRNSYDDELDKIEERATLFDLLPAYEIDEITENDSSDEGQQNIDSINAWARLSSEVIME